MKIFVNIFLANSTKQKIINIPEKQPKICMTPQILKNHSNHSVDHLLYMSLYLPLYQFDFLHMRKKNKK